MVPGGALRRPPSPPTTVDVSIVVLLASSRLASVSRRICGASFTAATTMLAVALIAASAPLLSVVM